jgi:hypothetical protein
MAIHFHEKAKVIFGVKQTAEGNCAMKTMAECRGKLSVSAAGVITGDSDTRFKYTTLTNDGLGDLTPGAYLYGKTGTTAFIIGQIASVASNSTAQLVATSGVTPFATSAAPSDSWYVALGPNNAIAVLNLTDSIDYTSEKFQYTGDTLDRNEVTVITDTQAKFSFETFLPTFGDSEKSDIAATPAIGTYVVPFEDWFGSIGMDAERSTGTGSGDVASIKYKNSADEEFMTVEIRRSSANTNYTNLEKTLLLSDVRGTLGLDIAIGTKAKLKWDMVGNYRGMRDAAKIAASEYKNLVLTQKTNTAATISADSIVAAEFVLDSGYLDVTFVGNSALTPVAFPAAAEITVYGLKATVKAGQTLTPAEAAKLFSDVAPGTTAAALGRVHPDLTTKVTLSGTLDKFVYTDIVDETAGKIRVYPKFPVKTVSATKVTGSTAGWVTATPGDTTVATRLTDIVGYSLGTGIAALAHKALNFDKLSAGNFAGFDFSRFKTGLMDGWTRGGVASDVTCSILEDRIFGEYVPEQHIEEMHGLILAWDSGPHRIVVAFDKLQLTGIGNGTISNFNAKDLTFSNIASKSEGLYSNIMILRKSY